MLDLLLLIIAGMVGLHCAIMVTIAIVGMVMNLFNSRG